VYDHTTTVGNSQPPGSTAAAERAPQPHQKKPSDMDRTASLAAGLEAVAALDKHALDEIKCLAKPPKGVEDVVVAVALIMGATATEWNDCKKLMADKKLLSKMQDVDSITISAKALKKLKKIVGAEDFNVEAITKKSKAAASLCAWVIGMYEAGAADNGSSALEKLQSAHPEEWKLFSAMDKDNSLGLDKDELWIKLSALGDEQANQVR
jgi:hypothetical protein